MFLGIVPCERLDRSPTTIRNYRSGIDKTIRRALGKIKLTKLSARHLDELYGAMKDSGASPKTICNHHATISSALHQEVRWGWVRDNVADRARPPQGTTAREGSIRGCGMSRGKCRRERDPWLAPLLMLGALTGMRRGELCALRWNDVDLERGELDVSHSVVVAVGGLAEKTTKTDRFRRVALDEVGVLLLRQHWANVVTWAKEAGGTVPADGYVFSPYIDGCKPLRPDNVTSFFIRVRDSLGLKEVRLHDLRHFTATQLIGAGVDVRTVAGRLGHSDPSLTLRVYSHLMKSETGLRPRTLAESLVPADPEISFILES
jgi:integrase